MKGRVSVPAVAVCLAAFFAIPAMANFDGAIQTTVANGSVVNQNLYATKDLAYLTGGPQNSNSNGLLDGTYYFQVTDPSGKTLLSTDAATCRQVKVVGGVVAHSWDGTNLDGAGTTYNPQDPNNWVLVSVACSHLIGTANTSNGELPVALMPYADTPNHGGVYKAWLISQDGSIGCDPANYPTPYDPFTAPSSCSKTDNYRVKASVGCTTDCTTPQSLISGLKFYDKGFNGSYINGVYTPPSAPNGTFDAGEAVLPNWTISFTGVNQGVPFTDTLTTDGGGAWADLSDVNSTITVCEVLQSGWSQSSPTIPTNIGGITAQAIGTGTQGPICWSGTVPSSDDISNLNFGNYEAVSGTKYYDTDVSATPTAGDTTIPGFKITFCDTFTLAVCSPISGIAFTDASGNYTFYLQSAGELYQIGETLPSVNNWFQTGPLSGAAPSPTNTGNGTVAGTTVKNWLTSIGGSANGLYFTNVCFVVNGNALTLGFWSNRNGQALETAGDFTTLTALNLRNADGSNRDFTASLAQNKTALASWLLSATATNMAYMLSAQLATMQLNVDHGLNGNLLIYAPGTTSANAAGFATINAVMAEANTLLGTNGVILSGNPLRARAQALETALDNANNSKNIVGGSGKCSLTTPY